VENQGQFQLKGWFPIAAKRKLQKKFVLDRLANPNIVNSGTTAATRDYQYLYFYHPEKSDSVLIFSASNEEEVNLLKINFWGNLDTVFQNSILSQATIINVDSVNIENRVTAKSRYVKFDNDYFIWNEDLQEFRHLGLLFFELEDDLLREAFYNQIIATNRNCELNLFESYSSSKFESLRQSSFEINFQDCRDITAISSDTRSFKKCSLKNAPSQSFAEIYPEVRDLKADTIFISTETVGAYTLLMTSILKNYFL